MREEIILYHGSKNIVESPEIRVTKYNKDFYFGFYCTTLDAQAKRWATRFDGKGILNEYRYIPNEELSVKVFPEMSEEWLDFILNCRRGKDMSEFDFVSGGVANDKVFNTIELYFDGLIEKQEALKRLQYEQPNLQYCFRSQELIDQSLKFVGSEKI